MIGQIIGLLVVGLVIGALARLIKPGRQRMSIVATLLLGVVGAFIGGFLGGLLNETGLGLVTRLLGEGGPGTPTPYSRLAPGDSVEL